MRRLVGTAALVLLLPLAACTTDRPAADPAPPAPTSSAPSATPSEPSPTPTESPSDEPSETLPPATDDPSLANLMRADFDGRGLRILREVPPVFPTDAYRRFEVTYRSNNQIVSGVLHRPNGPGPFPAVVLNHGYIDPSIYVTGQGMRRELDWLARAGFVALHTDYRGHAAGDPASDRDRELRLGYTRDAINAVLALEKQPYVDAERTAMVGRSMGGGVTLNALVAAPGLIDAAVIYAGVSSSYLENLRHFTMANRPEAARGLFEQYGAPQENPEFYDGLSSRSHFDRITEPVLIHHGAVDHTCPPRWARTTQRLLDRAGVDSRLVTYPGEDHTFYARWQDSIERTVRFLRRQWQV
jgi:uncharacterized protein